MMMKAKIDIDIESALRAELCDRSYRIDTALFWSGFNESATFVLHQLEYEFRVGNSGDFFDCDQRYIDIGTVKYLDDFGEDPNRAVNDFLKTAHFEKKRTPPEKRIRQYMWLDLARKSFIERFKVGRAERLRHTQHMRACNRYCLEEKRRKIA